MEQHGSRGEKVFVDCYEIWFDLKESHRDLEFARSLHEYMQFLFTRGLITGYRLTRRKLGFGPQGLGEFHVTIETRDLRQLEDAFQRAASRDSEIEPLHAKVYSAVKNTQFALYRDFPDGVRGAGAE
jgi:hypothetical protein